MLAHLRQINARVLRFHREHIVGQLLSEALGGARHVISELFKPNRAVVVFLFIHLFIHDILFRDAKAATSPLLVDGRGPPCRLHPGMQATIGPPRCSDIRSLLVLLMGALNLKGALVR
jgi:hypothetical protein